jgi:hypothetical protein
MTGLIGWTFRLVLFLLAPCLAIACVAVASAGASDTVSGELASIGEPGPDAIKFRIWTNKEEHEAFQPGDRAIIHLSAERQAYATMFAVSSEGHVTLLFPNKLMQDNIIEPNKLYTLFGDDSQVHMTAGERTSKGKIVIYLSTTPFVPDPLRIPENGVWLTIYGQAQKEMGILKDKLQSLAKAEGFNRATVPLPGGKGGDLEIQLKEVSTQGARKALPGTIESSIPETVTGSAGLKPMREDKQK